MKWSSAFFNGQVYFFLGNSILFPPYSIKSLHLPRINYAICQYHRIKAQKTRFKFVIHLL